MNDNLSFQENNNPFFNDSRNKRYQLYANHLDKLVSIEKIGKATLFHSTQKWKYAILWPLRAYRCIDQESAQEIPPRWCTTPLRLAAIVSQIPVVLGSLLTNCLLCDIQSIVGLWKIYSFLERYFMFISSVTYVASVPESPLAFLYCFFFSFIFAMLNLLYNHNNNHNRICFKIYATNICTPP